MSGSRCQSAESMTLSGSLKAGGQGAFAAEDVYWFSPTRPPPLIDHILQLSGNLRCRSDRNFSPEPN